MSSLFFQRLYENELLLTIETCNYIVVWMNFTIMFTETIVAAMHWSMPSGPCWLLQIARILWCIWQRHQGSSTPLIAKTYSDRVALIRCTCSISILEWSMKNYKAPWRSSKQRPHWDTQTETQGLLQIKILTKNFARISLKDGVMQVSSSHALLLDPSFFLAPGFLPDSEAHFLRLHPDKLLT